MGAARYGELITSIDFQRLEVFGEDYISQYMTQEIRKEAAEMRYRFYITDCLKAITQNTANINGGIVMKVNYSEIANSSESRAPKEPEKTAEEIVDEIISELNAYAGEGEASK